MELFNKNTTINVNNVIERIKLRLEIKTDKQLYELLKIKASTFSAWRVRDTLDYKLLLEFCVSKNINLEYAFFGKVEENPSKFNQELINFFDLVCSKVKDDINDDLESLRITQEKILTLLHKEEIKKEIKHAREDLNEKNLSDV